jgi:hypothetical protein
MAAVPRIPWGILVAVLVLYGVTRDGGAVVVILGMAVVVGLPAWCWLDHPAARRRDRLAKGQCPHCGYDLTGNVSGACPECGSLRP